MTSRRSAAACSISNPTFTGTTSGGDRFRFTAELVVPDAAPPERAAITRPAGTLELAGGPSVTLEAADGDLHIPTQRLDLSGAVRIATSDGYRIAADKATIDLRAGSFIAGDAVESTGPLGRIDLRQPARGAGHGRGRSAAVLFRKRRPAAIRSA